MLSLLPVFEDLSDEQERVYRLPLDDSSIVTGPPGTGKTVLALYRAQRLAQTEQGFRLLTYSKPLKQYVDAAADGIDVRGVVETFHSFIWSWWRTTAGGKPPQLAAYQHDWQAMMTKLSSKPETATYRHMIVDEGQDLHPMFWFLRPWLASSITVFADENQRISDDNSTLREIRSNAAISDDRHHRLTRNYRNTIEIHRVAEAFVTLDDTALVPTASGDVPEMIRFDSDRDEAEFIVRAARNHPDWQIGVLAPSEKSRKRLTNQITMRAGDDVEVQTYNSQLGRMGVELDWTTPGIFILNYESAKGLQFEHVFLPRLEMSNKDPAMETTRMLMYVMCTRARHALTTSWNGPSGGAPPALAKLFSWDLMDVDVGE